MPFTLVSPIQFIRYTQAPFRMWKLPAELGKRSQDRVQVHLRGPELKRQGIDATHTYWVQSELALPFSHQIPRERASIVSTSRGRGAK